MPRSHFAGARPDGPDAGLLTTPCFLQEKGGAKVAPPSLGRKRPRKQTARSGTALLQCTK
jgi:hypothetical protein